MLIEVFDEVNVLAAHPLTRPLRDERPRLLCPATTRDRSFASPWRSFPRFGTSSRGDRSADDQERDDRGRIVAISGVVSELGPAVGSARTLLMWCAHSSSEWNPNMCHWKKKEVNSAKYAMTLDPPGRNRRSASIFPLKTSLLVQPGGRVATRRANSPG
jgi:hypothetical protein